MPLSEVGYFYIVQPLPQLQPGRAKLGYSATPKKRLAHYQSICPEARIVRQWRCLPEWERAAIEYIAEGCTSIGREVFTHCDMGRMIERAEYFFTQAPAIPETVIDRSAWEQVTVYLPPDLREWLRTYAASVRRDISEICAEALQEYRARRGG